MNNPSSTGRNRVCPWYHGDAWQVEVTHRDGSVHSYTDRDLAHDHISLRAAQELHESYANSDLADRLAALPESLYPAYAPAIRAWFGYGDLVGTEHFPPRTHRAPQHPERFPLLSAEELCRGMWLARVRDHVDARHRFVDYHLRWGLSVREDDLARLANAIRRGDVVGASLKRAQEEIRWLRAGWWPEQLLRPGHGSGTYRLTGPNNLSVLAAPYPGAPVNGRVQAGALVNHAGETENGFVRLVSHLGWLADSWLVEVSGGPDADGGASGT